MLANIFSNYHCCQYIRYWQRFSTTEWLSYVMHLKVMCEHCVPYHCASIRKKGVTCKSYALQCCTVLLTSQISKKKLTLTSKSMSANEWRGEGLTTSHCKYNSSCQNSIARNRGYIHYKLMSNKRAHEWTHLHVRYGFHHKHSPSMSVA